MATAAQVMDRINTKLLATLPNTPARMASDLDSTLQPVPAGTTRYQLAAFAGPESPTRDTAVSFYPGMAVRLRVHYHLNVGQAETGWTATTMQNTISTLLDPDWWRTILGVFTVDNLPEVAVADIVRVGRVISFTLTLTLTVDPSAA